MQTEEQKKRKKALKIVGALVAAFLLGSCCSIGGLAFLGSEPTAMPALAPVVESSLPTSTPTTIPTIATLVVATSTPTPTPEFERTEAQVIEVVDGDTIKVEIVGTDYTVRYIGIDTPETVHPTKPVEWMGPEASEANRRLVEGQTVYLEKDVSETDRYGRLLCYVFLTDGLFVNAELVRLGYAHVSTYPPNVHYQDLFLEMQQEAREVEHGLWGPTPTPLPAATAVPILPPKAPVVQPTASPSWWMCPNSTEGAAYVGSVQTDPLKFHSLSCRWAAKISGTNRICFSTRQAALDLGYRPCKVCNP